MIQAFNPALINLPFNDTFRCSSGCVSVTRHAFIPSPFEDLTLSVTQPLRNATFSDISDSSPNIGEVKPLTLHQEQDVRRYQRE
jgi:hypothetical protein